MVFNTTHLTSPKSAPFLEQGNIYIYIIYIYIIYIYIYRERERIDRLQSSAPGALSTLVTSVVLYSLTRATLISPGKDETRVFG